MARPLAHQRGVPRARRPELAAPPQPPLGAGIVDEVPVVEGRQRAGRMPALPGLAHRFEQAQPLGRGGHLGRRFAELGQQPGQFGTHPAGQCGAGVARGVGPGQGAQPSHQRRERHAAVARAAFVQAQPAAQALGQRLHQACLARAGRRAQQDQLPGGQAVRQLLQRVAAAHQRHGGRQPCRRRAGRCRAYGSRSFGRRRTAPQLLGQGLRGGQGPQPEFAGQGLAAAFVHGQRGLAFAERGVQRHRPHAVPLLQRVGVQQRTCPGQGPPGLACGLPACDLAFGGLAPRLGPAVAPRHQPGAQGTGRFQPRQQQWCLLGRIGLAIGPGPCLCDIERHRGPQGQNLAVGVEQRLEAGLAQAVQRAPQVAADVAVAVVPQQGCQASARRRPLHGQHRQQSQALAIWKPQRLVAVMGHGRAEQVQAGGRTHRARPGTPVEVEGRTGGRQGLPGPPF
jgi:hypothetical protein